MKVLYVDLDREWRGGQSQALLTVKGLRALGMTRSRLLCGVRRSLAGRGPQAYRCTTSGIGRDEPARLFFCVNCFRSRATRYSMPMSRTR